MKKAMVSGIAAGFAYWFWRYISPQHSTIVLADKVVLISGASSGIGEALAHAFARRGAKLALLARREERLHDVAQRIAPYAAESVVIPADVTNADERSRAIAQVLGQFGTIDILVNSAGVFGGGYFEEMDRDVVLRQLDVNLKAALLLTHEVLAHMKARNSGYIVNVGSGMGRVPVPGLAAYVSTKAGLAAFSDTLRRELVDTSIKILYAAPSWVRTEMISPEAEVLLEKLPQHDLKSAETVATAIVGALVQGRHEVYTGNWLERSGIWLERHFPLVADLYWRLVWRYQPWLELTQKVG